MDRAACENARKIRAIAPNAAKSSASYDSTAASRCTWRYGINYQELGSGAIRTEVNARSIQEIVKYFANYCR